MDNETSTTATTPLKAIKENCKQCSGDSSYEAKLCNAKKCPLWPFRLGKNPFINKQPRTDEQKESAALRLREYNERKKAEKNLENAPNDSDV